MAAQDQEVTRLSIRGKEYPVRLRVYSWGDRRPPQSKFVLQGIQQGRYRHEVTADTLDDLYQKGMAASKAAATKIEFPIMRVVNKGRYSEPARYEFESGIVTGRHQGNGNALVRWSGSKEDTTGYNRREFFRPLSEADQREYLRLRLEQDKIEAQIAAIHDRYVIEDIAATIEEEIERKASEVADDE